MTQNHRFVIFDILDNDPAARAMAEGDETTALRRLVSFAEEHGIRGNVWPAYLCRLLSGADNVFTRTVERTDDATFA